MTDTSPTLWIDADAAPGDVKDIVARAALRLELTTYLVANQRLQTPANNPFVTAIRVAGGPDVADDHIAENATPGDLAVTADIPLAARLVEKGVVTLDPRGGSTRPRTSVSGSPYGTSWTASGPPAWTRADHAPGDEETPRPSREPWTGHSRGCSDPDRRDPGCARSPAAHV